VATFCPVIADEPTREAVLTLIGQTYQAMSTPGSDVADLFGSPDIAIAGSGQGELWAGPEAVMAASVVSSWGFRWTPGDVTVWRRGDVAWAQILGSVHVVREGIDEVVPYRTTGVFGWDDDRWRWLYWGGSEPQESAKV
jgi:SnoaL-like domain